MYNSDISHYLNSDWNEPLAGISSLDEQTGSFYDGHNSMFSPFPAAAYHPSSDLCHSLFPALTSNSPAPSYMSAPNIHPTDGWPSQPPISIDHMSSLPPELTEKLRNSTKYSAKTIKNIKENNAGSYWAVQFVECSEACYVCKKRTNSGEICGQICASSSGINKHFLSKVHQTQTTVSYSCEHPVFPCDARFTRKDALKRHLEAGSLHKAPKSGGSQQ